MERARAGRAVQRALEQVPKDTVEYQDVKPEWFRHAFERALDLASGFRLSPNRRYRILAVAFQIDEP